MQKTHTLKTHREHFQQSLGGVKPFEIRLDDRGYETGDVVVLAEYDKETKKYTERYISGTIGAVTDFAQKPGHVVFAILGMKKLWMKEERMSKFKKQRELVLSELGCIFDQYASFHFAIDSVGEYDIEADEASLLVTVTSADRPTWKCRMYLVADTESARLEAYDSTYEELTSDAVWRYLFFDLLECIK